MSARAEVFDVVVVGAGLAGLTAALHLARAGQRVLVLERSDRPGGLCGTYTRDGYTFVIGCNDFGTGMAREMAELGVPVRFVHRRARFVFERETYQVPPTPGTLLTVLRHAADVVRLARALSGRGGAAHADTLGALTQACVRNADFADFFLSLAYPMGLAPGDFRLQDMKAALSKELAYGYDKPTIPVGGPGVLVGALCARLAELGGTLRLGVACERIEREGTLKHVVTREGTFQARHVVTSEGRWESYPANSKPGMACSMLHLALQKDFPYPAGIHTLCSFPPDVRGWLSALDRGELPEAFGFHLFPCADMPEARDYLPVNVVLYLPRGMEDPTPEVQQRVVAQVLRRAERLLPGLSSALRYQRFVSPGEYVRLHGFSSAPLLRALPSGIEKPQAYEAERDVYHVGNSVQPAGDHAGGAILSGVRAARAILEATRAAPRPDVPAATG